MEYSLGISNLLEEISSFFSFYCFPLFLCIVPLRKLSYLSVHFELCIHLDIYFLFSFAFHLFSFLSYIKSLQTTIVPSCMSFDLELYSHIKFNFLPAIINYEALHLLFNVLETWTYSCKTGV